MWRSVDSEFHVQLQMNVPVQRHVDKRECADYRVGRDLFSSYAIPRLGSGRLATSTSMSASSRGKVRSGVSIQMGVGGSLVVDGMYTASQRVHPLYAKRIGQK